MTRKFANEAPGVVIIFSIDKSLDDPVKYPLEILDRRRSDPFIGP